MADKDKNLQPLSNSTNLLDEALTRLSTEQRERLMGKAAEEALNLQVKQAHMNVDSRAASSKFDNIISTSRRAPTDKEVEMYEEHRSEHGHAYIKIKSNHLLPVIKIVAVIVVGIIILRILHVI